MSLYEQRGKTGREAESLASQYLEKRGCRIVERNFTTPKAEIDIIARHGDCLCFVEVRSQTGRYVRDAAMTVNWTKQQKIITGARMYLARHGLQNSESRFDVISVQFAVNDGVLEPADIKWLKGAFRLGDNARSSRYVW